MLLPVDDLKNQIIIHQPLTLPPLESAVEVEEEETSPEERCSKMCLSCVAHRDDQARTK